MIPAEGESSAGQAALCGAGRLAGVRQTSGNVQLSFVSNDPDPGCGFDKGLRFTLNGTLRSGASVFEGSYDVGTTAAGTFRLRSGAQGNYLPIVTR